MPAVVPGSSSASIFRPGTATTPTTAGPAYVAYYRNQLRELLTNYGEIFEVWFDGANGGDGFYGGARETRNIDRHTYYDWPNTISMVRQLQPSAVMFSDAGPDLRWVGNEAGYAGDPCWAAYTPTASTPASLSPAARCIRRASRAIATGSSGCPPRSMFPSVRAGSTTPPRMPRSVRRKTCSRCITNPWAGALLLLNLPPDRRGRIHEADIASLREFRRILDATFTRNLATGAAASADNIRGNDARFAAANVLDGRDDTYWATDDDRTTAELTLDLGGLVSFNVVSLREYLPLGQRIDEFALEVFEGGQWRQFACGQSIGSRRLWRGETLTASKLRLRILPRRPAPPSPSLPHTKNETTNVTNEDQ